MTAGTDRVREDAERRGIPIKIVERPPATSLENAAELLGITPAEIVKSLVVKRSDGTYLFALVPGDRHRHHNRRVNRLMAINNHPNVFRFEGRTWVSLSPGEEALEELRAQRAWDAANAKLQRWWVAITIGAVVAVAGTLALGISAELDPTAYLLLLPLAFGGGAIAGALVNKRFNAPDRQHASLPDRPSTVPLTQVPSRVARAAPEHATATEIIEWSNRGFVG